MDEKLGIVLHRKPIPDATRSRALKFQEAARLRIHSTWTYAKIGNHLHIDASWLTKVAREDKWDDFAELLSAQAFPSIYTGVEAHEHKLMVEEKLRRTKDLKNLRNEESRIRKNMAKCSPGTANYNRCLTALKVLRELIDQVLDVKSHRSEQSAARKKGLTEHVKNQIEKAREGGEEEPEESFVRKASVIDISDIKSSGSDGEAEEGS